MARVTLAAIVAAGAIAAMPAKAQVASSADEARLRAAIAQAEEARNAAAEALRKADEAIALLKQGLTPSAPLAKDPASATELRQEETGRIAVKRPPEMPYCDAAAGDRGSIGDYLLRARQKRESGYDSHDEGTNDGINAFVYHCLGLTRVTDYENLTNLSAQFTGAKGTDQIEIAITRTSRAVKLSEVWDAKAGKKVAGVFATYNRYSLGSFGRTGSNGDAPLIDLTESNFASGVGVVLGYEWGRMPVRTLAKARGAIHTGIAAARRDCVAAKGVVEPLEGKDPAPGDRPRVALNPIAACEGDELVKWMADPKQANRYWSAIVAPLWGYAATPDRFAGVQFRYAFQDVSFRPVIDPRTGAVIATTLPPTQTIHPEPYSIKLYAGFNHPINYHAKERATIGLVGSLTYRREVDFIDGTSKTVCTPPVPGATFNICSADQKLAAPYNTKGFVGGIALNLQFKRFWYLPPIAVAPRFTYAFDTKRPGLEIPLFLLTDADGKLNSGLKYTCRFKGETREGFELKKSCNVNLFVGTSFDIRNAP